MKKTYDVKKNRDNWILEEWYQKAVYIIGLIASVMYGLAFILGFITGITNGF